MHKKLYIIFIIIVFTTIILSSCDEEKRREFKSDIVFPDSSISFSKYVDPLFKQTCVATTCHGNNQTAGNLNLEYDAWRALIDHMPKIIYENDGNNSPLIMYLDGRLSPPMPPTKLTQNQINGVKKWIDEGAYNN